VLLLQDVGSAAVYLHYIIARTVRNLLPAFRAFHNLDIAGYYRGDQNMEGWVVEGAVRQGRGRGTCRGLVGRTAGQRVLRNFILDNPWP
jgi:hypothetical protein